jgi:multidrug resistance efflux pump
MHGRARIVLPILLVAALAGGFYWWNGRQASAAEIPGTLTGSGTIEAEDVLITAEVSGRVQSLPVDEGQEVQAGQLLAKLDPALLEAQLAQARASIAVAEANLALLKAGPREEEVLAAQAAVDQAKAARDGAEQAFENAQQNVKNPQELNLQVAQAQASRDAARRSLERLRAGNRAEDIAAAKAALAQAQLGLQGGHDKLSAAKTTAEAAMRQATEALVQAQARYAQAKINWESVESDGIDPIVRVVTDAQGRPHPNKVSDASRNNYYNTFVQAEAAMRAAEQGVEAARVNYDASRQGEVTGVQTAEEQVQAAQATLQKLEHGATREDLAQAQTALASAQRTLDVLSATRASPQGLKAAADNAQAQVASATAQLAQAQARLDQVRNGTRSEQIAVAAAQVEQARAATKQIEVQLAKTTLTAPRAGVVLSRPIREGEQASVGAPLMTIGSLDTVRLTLYIAESAIGRVRPGQRVSVTVNSFPGRIFAGTVTYIASEAQFTPRNVQTKDERATTVFAVRVDLPNSDHALKPGMPADATIAE